MIRLTRFNQEVVNNETYYYFYFDNDVWVGINKAAESWAYQEGDDGKSYLEGSYSRDGRYIEDYDGCYELPAEVLIAFRKLGYSTTRL